MGSQVYDNILSNFTDYRSKTTFWDDFSIADSYEELEPGAIERTYVSAMSHWKKDYEYLTELVMVLNHKLWQWFDTDKTRAAIYNDLFVQARKYAETYLKGDELAYYYRVTD